MCRVLRVIAEGTKSPKTPKIENKRKRDCKLLLVLLCYDNFPHCSCKTYMFTRPNLNTVILSTITSNTIISKPELVKELSLKCKTTFIRRKLKIDISFQISSKIENNKNF